MIQMTPKWLQWSIMEKKDQKLFVNFYFQFQNTWFLILQLVMVEFEIETLLKLCTIHIV